MTTTAATIIEQADDTARHVWRTTSIDLDAFLRLSKEERGAMWRQWDRAAKQQAVCKMLERQFGDWQPEAVAHWVAHYDRKWEVGDAAASDLAIPPASEILDRVSEDKKQAQQHGDFAGVRQLDRIRVNILRGTRIWWCRGDLLVQSVNNPGQTYSTNKRGCSCRNGEAGMSQCWHAALHDLLTDLQEDRAAAADIVADAAAERRELGRRLAVARALCMGAA